MNPHYLIKAKHYWNPEFCTGDFFLDSANPHLVFYQTFGSFTRWLTLDQAAWLGRAIAALILAIGWTEMTSRICRGRWAPVWCAWVYLALMAIASLPRSSLLRPFFERISPKLFDFSGEWIVGGVEAKVIAYALVFWGIAYVIDDGWRKAAICFGLAISFHPVVGCWAVVCAAFAQFSLRILPNRRSDESTDGHATHPGWGAMLLLVLCAIPGLWPALQLLGSASPVDQFDADYIQVFERLKHHLDPMTFSTTSYVSFALMCVLWLAGRRVAHLQNNERWLTRFVIASLLIAACGVLIGYRQVAQPLDASFLRERVALLKFYPFRLADAFVPIMVSLVLVGIVQRWCCPRQSSTSVAHRQRADFRCWPVFAAALLAALILPSPDRQPRNMSDRQLADWRAACQWIRDNTAPDAVIATPGHHWAFKWYAERGEYVSFKDCPQDALGIIEWYERLNDQKSWQPKKRFARRLSRERGARLNAEQGITHLLTSVPQHVDFEPVYKNDSYSVFELPNRGADPTRSGED